MNILQISIIAIVATVLSVLLKKNAPEYSLYIGLVLGLIVIGCVVGYIKIISLCCVKLSKYSV